MAEPDDILPPRYTNPTSIGRGGMGDIFRAHDETLGRDVAVKLLAERFADDIDARRRFTREANTAARLSSHPNIVTIYDVGEWNGRPFIVMELGQGGTLSSRASEARIGHDQAIAWLRQAAAALDTAHAAGIVHRDVKPANLLLDAHGDVQVADFGIARVLDVSTTAMTVAGTVLGTAGYLSPEQARGEPATPASDVYGLGVVGYELLTGGRPFERGSATAEALAHVNEPPPPASQRGVGIPRAVDSVFERALAKEPAARYPTAGAFVDDLEAALGRAPARHTTARTVALAPRGRGRPWLPAALVAALLAAGATGAVLAAVLTGGDDRPAAAGATVRETVTEEAGVTVRETVTEEAPPTQAEEPAESAAQPASGAELNDQGFALMNEGRYEEALPLLQQAVEALRGTYSADAPQEAWANYNLGFTLLALGTCAEAIPFFDYSASLQGERKEIKRARREAEKCA
jgi:serine/threonine-protein kinase